MYVCVHLLVCVCVWGGGGGGGEEINNYAHNYQIKQSKKFTKTAQSSLLITLQIFHVKIPLSNRLLVQNTPKQPSEQSFKQLLEKPPEKALTETQYPAMHGFEAQASKIHVSVGLGRLQPEIPGRVGWEGWVGGLGGRVGWEGWVGGLGGRVGWEGWVGGLGGMAGCKGEVEG